MYSNNLSAFHHLNSTGITQAHGKYHKYSHGWGHDGGFDMEMEQHSIEN